MTTPAPPSPRPPDTDVWAESFELVIDLLVHVEGRLARLEGAGAAVADRTTTAADVTAGLMRVEEALAALRRAEPDHAAAEPVAGRANGNGAGHGGQAVPRSRRMAALLPFRRRGVAAVSR